MVLRIAWANYPRDVGLAIAANIFTYAGTIILYMVNWFFAQRILRAQHPSLGWSTHYRIFHRGGLFFLIATLIGLIISQIWKFFTLDPVKLDAFRALFLIAQTYATAFCFAPAILVCLSLLIPRAEVEKFGAGRLRNNITILLISVCVLSVGQVFRCVLAWIPPTLMVDVQRGRVQLPWYLSKASFYCFNFVTEIFVVMLFAAVRVDLRFYIPNGANKTGDYSRSRVDLHNEDEKNPTVINITRNSMANPNDSNETLHQYPASVFEDTQTLADSLRYPHSTLEVDEKTGNWKVKRLSQDSTKSRHSLNAMSKPSQSTLHGGSSTPPAHASSSRASSSKSVDASGALIRHRTSRDTNSTPPVPELPADWPLPGAVPPKGASPVLEHSNGSSSKALKRKKTFELENHELNNVDVGDAVTDALARLETNSGGSMSKLPMRPPPPVYYQSNMPLPKYNAMAAMHTTNGRVSPKRTAKYTVYPPPKQALHNRCNSTPNATPRPSLSYEVPEPCRAHRSSHSTSVPNRPTGLSSSPSLEIISLLNHMSGDQSRIIDASLLREPTDTPTNPNYPLERSPMISHQRSQHNKMNNGNPNLTTPRPTIYHPPRNEQYDVIKSNHLPPPPSSSSSAGSSDSLSTPDHRHKVHAAWDYGHEYSPSSVDTEEKAWAQEEFRKFSASPQPAASTRHHHS